MLEALQEYLESSGFDNVFIDFMPDAVEYPSCVYVGCYLHIPDDNATDGGGTRYIQIQVRRPDSNQALRDCGELWKLLDSGVDEELIWLDDETYCLARPKKGPRILERGGNYTTYYCELTLWGEN